MIKLTQKGTYALYEVTQTADVSEALRRLLDEFGERCACWTILMPGIQKGDILSQKGYVGAHAALCDHRHYKVKCGEKTLRRLLKKHMPNAGITI